VKVKNALDTMGVSVEMRNVMDPRERDRLIELGGKDSNTIFVHSGQRCSLV
jgi:hypothetical protein